MIRGLFASGSLDHDRIVEAVHSVAEGH